MTEHQTNVVVIGGGYAGTIAANRLLSAHVEVTLVNPRPSFVERIRLHQLVTGSDDAVVDYTTVLAPGVRLVVDEAVAVDAAARTVILGSGQRPGSTRLPYDYLIYAVGSTSCAPTVRGAAEFGYPIGTLEEAARLRQALGTVGGDQPICVVGGGATGIETAAELAEAGRPVTLVCGRELGPYLSAPGRRSAARRLAKLGVTVLDGPGATVTEVRAGAIVVGADREIPSALTIWTAGFEVPQLAADSGLPTDAIGRLLTDETLTCIDDERIVAAGDAAAPSGQPLRMSCQAAMPLGAQAADTVLHRIAGTEPAAVNQAFVGQCISLGRRAGVIQVAKPDDTTLPLYLSGRAAARIKETVCRSTVSSIANEAREPGSFRWLKGGNRQRRLAVAESPR